MTALRRITKGKEWTPHAYQQRAVDHLYERGSAMLWLDPGMGKTSVVLSAFDSLLRAGMAEKMLVVAPLRVCQMVWQQEAQKWSQFHELTFSLIHGPEKKRIEALEAPADVYLINYEGLPWLCNRFSTPKSSFARSARVAGKLPFDTLVFDEVTRVKNPSAKRSKRMHAFADKAVRRWGLTGTPNPNGYMDLFGQFLMVDGGAALGRYITHFRDRYFVQGYNGFDYTLRSGADAEIEERIRPYVFRASAAEYLSLPPLVEHRIELELDTKSREVYKKMKRDMLAELGDSTITAANAAATYSKLKQMANGAVYTTAPEHEELHDVKINALADLVEELGGSPLLVAYEFQHDLSRLLEKFPDTPFLGGGVSGKRASEIEADWNAGKIRLLFAHPASAGHGLNLQGSSASHLCWFSQTWDYELYDQFIRRIHRQGTNATRIMNHKLIVKNTIDEDVEAALNSKETTQGRLLSALKSVFEDDGEAVVIGEEDMAIRRIGSPGTVEPTAQVQQTFAAQAQPAAPVGWPSTTQAPTQRETVQAKIAPQEAAPVAAGWPATGTGQAISTGQERVETPFSESINYRLVGEPAAPAAVQEEKSRKRRTKAEIEADNAAATKPGAQSNSCSAAHEEKDYSIKMDVAALVAAFLQAGLSADDALSRLADTIDYLRSGSQA